MKSRPFRMKWLSVLIVSLSFNNLGLAKEPKGLVKLEPPFSDLASEFYNSDFTKSKDKVIDLIELKKIVAKDDFSGCLKNVTQVKATHKELMGWLSLIEMQCLNSLFTPDITMLTLAKTINKNLSKANGKSNLKNAGRASAKAQGKSQKIDQASDQVSDKTGDHNSSGTKPSIKKTELQILKIFRSLEGKDSVLEEGPWSENLRKVFVPTFIRWTKISNDNSAILLQLNIAIEWGSVFTVEQQSRLLEAFGDFYNRIKRSDMAQPYFKRAYGLYPSILLSLKIQEPVEISASKSPPPCTEEEKLAGDEIIELVRKGAIDSKNEKLESLKKLTVSCREDVQSRLLNTWQFSILRAGDLDKTNYLSFFYFFSDSERGKLLQNLFTRSAHNEIILLTEKLKSDATQAEFDSYYWRARSFTEILKLTEAAEAFTKAIKVANDLNSKEDALLRLGFVLLRDKKVERALEGFLQTVESTLSENKARALFWTWQCYLKLEDKEKASVYAKKLMIESPDSYWGLKAQIAMNDGKIKWQDATIVDKKNETRASVKKVETADQTNWPAETVALTGEWSQSYSRYRLLALAGWWSEALRELKTWPIPVSKNDRWGRMRLYTSVLAYPDAYNLMKDEDVLAELPPHYLKLVFPKEYDKIVESEAKKVGLHPMFLQSVMKQESAFYPFAISSARAMGLLQLVPNTAKENAQLLRLKEFSIEDLYVPAINIQLGSYYMSRLVKKYQKHIPLSLVAYNAGPGRLDRWLNKREGLLARLISKQEDFEDLWLEEIPWRESQLYVRRILRNWLIMRSLYDSQAQFTSPVWSEVLFTSVKPLDTL